MGTESLRLTAGATSVHDLTDDLLELVLLGLSSSGCLVRASATCKRWHRLVAGTDGGGFLSRFRSLHPPRAIGTFYSINPDPYRPRSYGQHHLWPEVDPVFVPSSTSASDGPTGLQLSLDFVPPANRGTRELVDGRGSLLLLLGEKDDRTEPPVCMCCWISPDYMTPDLVVCEPLTQQYQAIPPPIRNVCVLGAFLLNGDADEACDGAAIGMTNFSVLLVQYEHDYWNDRANSHGHPLASVFTRGGRNGGWYYGEKDEAGVYLPSLDEVHLAGRTGGRIYWGCDDKQVLVLDEHTLQFSAMAVSEHMMNRMGFDRNKFRVIGGGHAGTARIIHLTYNGELEVFGQLCGDGGNDDWVLEMSVRMEEASASPGLPVEHEEEDYDLVTGTRIIDTAEGLVVLLSPQMGAFSVDLEAMELKREDGRKEYTGPAFPYTLPWPPVMRACDNMAPKGERENEIEEEREWTI